MIRATNQTCLFLAMISGTLKIMVMENMLPKEIDATVVWAQEHSARILAEYPQTGDRGKNLKIMKTALAAWREVSDSYGDWHPLALNTMALNLCEDLLRKIRNPTVRFDLEALRDALVRIADYWLKDAGEELYTHIGEADVMVREIHQIVEFV